MKARLRNCAWPRIAFKAAVGGLLLAVSALGVSCKKETEKATTTLTREEIKLAENNVSKGAPVAQTQAQPHPLAVAADADAQAVLNQLTREVRRFILRTQRPPSTFEDFASKSGVKFPPPPTGKKYELTRQMQVILVNQ
jgi:hypothetical protein